MTVVVEELLESSGCSDSGTGVSITRGFHVTGLTGNKESRIINALTDDKIPKLGDPHPTNGWLYVLNRDARMTDVGQARIGIEYGIPRVDAGDAGAGSGGGIDGRATGINEATAEGTISVGSSSSTVSRFRDTSGRLMTVGSIVEVEKKIADPKSGITSKATVKEPLIQVKEAEVVVPQTVLRVSRLEESSPQRLSISLVGTVNSRSFAGGGAVSWLCTRIDGTSNDGGETYNVTYEFQYNQDLWVFEAVWIDPKTGQPAFKDLTGEETHFYNVYKTNDFNQLGLKV